MRDRVYGCVGGVYVRTQVKEKLSPPREGHTSPTRV